MTAHVPATISTLLQQLHGHGYFRPEAGPLRERLLEAVALTIKGEGIERLADPTLDLEVSIGCPDAEEEVALGVRVNLSGAPCRAELALKELQEAEFEDLAGYLSRLIEVAPPAPSAEPGTPVQRAKPEGDYHEQDTAAARLKVSPQWLKSVVPCTEYTYDEIDGKKFIRDYYWSKELIERLFKIKSSKTTPEDLQYVASECCEGDPDWARDLIARLKSPNRVEPPARESGQKNQGQHQGQGRAAGQAQGQNQGQGQGQNQGQPGKGERSRSRSRHKRGLRDGGKKQGAPGPKPPAGPNQGA